MKKTLLIIAVALTTVVALNAQQTKIWNLGGDPTVGNAWATSAGIGKGDGTEGNPAFPVSIDGLAMTGISTNANMGAVNASPKTFTDANNVSYEFANRFQFNGGGYPGAANTDATPSVNMPTQRFLSINVTGNSTIYAIGITGSSSTARSIFVTDGTNLVGKMDFPAASVLNDATVNYTGNAATLYLFCNAACNLAYLSATNVATSSVKSILSNKGISFNGTEITNPNGLELEVYSAIGTKIITSNTAISAKKLQKGVYIVRAKGTKDVLKLSI